jgi:X-X-X-Leu-X-X-Gly heptad repeat protein
MNKTLLLILCDFLLLTLLALTRWETAEPPAPKQPPVPEMAANAVTKDQDLVETMRQSLADEKATRDELAQKLTSAETALASREQSLTQVQAERARLAQEKSAVAASLGETQRTAAQLGEKLTAATQEASMTKEQLAQLQRELAEKQALADKLEQQRAALEKQHADARKQIEGLTLAVVVAEQEKKNLRETADALKGQVDVERSERVKVQEANTQLAQGVGQLAEKSGQLTKEIRENRPINANVLFNDYLTNRVTASFSATRRGMLGPVNKAKDTDTVLVTDGRQVYALVHAADTAIAFGEYGVEWESLSVELAHGGAGRMPAHQVQFLAQDPRIMVIPLDASQVSALGARVYPLAADPFKFPEAVLIDGGGRGYGEVGFKLDPSEAGYVRVDNRFFKRLFGDFKPKSGDLVFAKTGELLGIMVNNDYCAVLKDFSAQRTITPGKDIKSQQTAAIFDSLIARVRALPVKLQ